MTKIEKKPALRRRRTTRASVWWADRIARSLITLGGAGTIVAVLLVFVFLVGVVIPLFKGAKLTEKKSDAVASSSTHDASPLHFALDEYQTLAWALYPDGILEVIRLDNGKVIESAKPFGDAKATAVKIDSQAGNAAVGFADGSIRLGKIGATISFLNADEAPEPVRAIKTGELAEFSGGLVAKTPEGQLRLGKITVELDEPIATSAGSPIILIDRVDQSSGPAFCAVTADGKLKIGLIRERKNMLTQKVTRDLTMGEATLDAQGRGQPRFALLSRLGDSAYVAWGDGRLVRFDTRDLENIRPLESVDISPGTGATIDSLAFLQGKTTLLAGDSAGNIRAWFGIKPPQAETGDGSVLVPAHTLTGANSAITWLAASQRSRTVAAGYADGEVRLFYVTSGKLLASDRIVNLPAGKTGALAVAIAPKDDGFAALGGGELAHWKMDIGHPEATLTSLFRPVWYEGYEKPTHVWQSSSGTDDFEPKLGLMPLVFGTIKATVYSMLFGVPLALLAAIYTSQFLNPRFRSKIKPVVELMASLPSVVLGFLAAIVFAPFVEHVLPVVLVSILIVPLSFSMCAYLWQLMPQNIATRLSHYRFAMIIAALPIGVAAAVFAAPTVERLLFGGNLRLWLNGQVGSPIGGWMIFFLPLCAFSSLAFNATVAMPWLRRISLDWSRARCAVADLLLFLSGVAVAVAVSTLISSTLTGMGLDLRGEVLGTYVQRNAMIVGFVMGFAIIPIIYTISDDALSTVPEHLRSASLAAGATQWQTATRVIIPTAMSGLFSAIMIGLGRAVGETMIVLMAAGNTPIMEWNIFNGFRTLSANIAVELPEAARGSTHYRTLFLAALTLFAITFLLNTIAESVRQRFRKRAYQL